MNETQLRRSAVSIAESWEGRKEGSSGHKEIIDIYNSRKPLPRGYKMTLNDAWCAATVSAISIKAGLTDIMPVECSCAQLIAAYKKLGRWVENDAYVPQIGDLCFYDWQDSGAGDCTGAPDHVGIVVKVQSGMFTVMEGNKNGSPDYVGRRNVAVNGRYIRGFATPNYASKATSASVSKPTQTAPKQPKIGFASSKDSKLARTYEVNAASGLWLRTDAGKNSTAVTLMPNGLRVTCYGYYSTVSGDKWLLVSVTDNRIQFKKYKGMTGFCSAKYLK